jgi:hypothetical protein
MKKNILLELTEIEYDEYRLFKDNQNKILENTTAIYLWFNDMFDDKVAKLHFLEKDKVTDILINEIENLKKEVFKLRDENFKIKPKKRCWF